MVISDRTRSNVLITLSSRVNKETEGKNQMINKVCEDWKVKSTRTPAIAKIGKMILLIFILAIKSTKIGHII